MIKSKDKVINTRKITTTTFPGRKSLNLKNRLLKVLGEPFAQAAGGIKSFKAANLLHTDLSIFIPAIEKLCQNIDPEIFNNLVIELLSMTRIDGKEITEEIFDMEFAGNLCLMYKIIFFVMEVNWGDFFGENGIGSTLLLKQQQTEKSIPKK
jgi:hypothetical protein